MNYRIGLDIGITSVGWSVIENHDDGEPIKIVNLGSRIFEKAENPKTGASLASARREARSSRRRIRRRRHRLERIKYLFETSGLITLEDLENIYNSNRDLENVYKLRYDALNRKLTNEELARVLLHLAKRRGYKANSKAQESSDKETGKLLTAIEENSKLMEFSNYRTIGEMIWKDSKFKTYSGSKFIEKDLAPRNKPADYKNTMPRFLLIDEITYIFKSQRKFGFDLASSDFEQNYIKIFESQRKFDEGPGGESQSGYALAKFKEKSAKYFYSFFTFGIMIPIQITLIPLFIFYSKIGILNTTFSLILPQVGFALPLSIMLFVDFFSFVPNELIEASNLDGCTPYSTFTRIMLPMAKNTFVTIASMYFILIWNDFIFSNTFISKNSAKTVPLGLKDYVGAFGNVNWGLTFAAISISILPPLVIYFILNKQVTSGMTIGATKG